MKMTRISAAVMFVAGSVVALQFALAQTPEIKRTELQRHDLGTPRQEAVQFRVDFHPGAALPKHSHPGEEITYILEGSLEFEIDGKPTATLKAGDVVFIPAGTIHSAKNAGTTNAAAITTYVVEKGKPLVIPAK
ncbi:cupin [Verrucomicrobia bacterium SCGC AG-212-E04]|nr:cupin [Verrucomicrobia bacterium SCGC AG-212-E04]